MRKRVRGLHIGGSRLCDGSDQLRDKCLKVVVLGYEVGLTVDLCKDAMLGIRFNLCGNDAFLRGAIRLLGGLDSPGFPQLFDGSLDISISFL